MKRLAQREWFVLLTIIFAAACIRFYQLDTLPLGLYHDEAVNGIDALSVLNGERPLYFEANNGREPLYIYLLAASISIWGATPLAIRLVSAILGTLFIAAVYWLGRETNGRLVATYAACLAAISIWAINLSRVGFRTISFLPIATAALAFLVHSQKRRSHRSAAAGGALLGLSLYTYLASRAGIAAIGLMIIYLGIWHRKQTWWRGVLISAVTAMLVAAPLGAYWLTHWQETFGRMGQVSIFNPAVNNGQPWHMLFQNIGNTALGFFWRGDFIPRHNIPLQPVFYPLVAVFFALGLLLCLRRARHDAIAGCLLIWFVIMLIPTIIAENAPHYLRASGVLPILYLIPAIGMNALVERLGKTGLAYSAMAIVLGMTAIMAPSAYMHHLHSDEVYYQFESAAAELANQVNSFVGTDWTNTTHVKDIAADTELKTYIAPRFYDSWQSIAFLTSEAHEQRLVTSIPSELAGAKDVLLVFWPYEPWDTLLPYLPPNRMISVSEGGQQKGDLEAEPNLLNASIWTSPVSTTANINAQFDDGIQLLGYSSTYDDGRITLTLYWQCTQSVGSSLSVFVHLLESDTIRRQDDGPLAMGYYGTEHWRAGDVVRDIHTFSYDATQTMDDLTARVGLYHWDTLKRLNVSQQGSLSNWVDISLQEFKQ